MQPEERKLKQFWAKNPARKSSSILMESLGPMKHVSNALRCLHVEESHLKWNRYESFGNTRSLSPSTQYIPHRYLRMLYHIEYSEPSGIWIQVKLLSSS